MKKKTKIFTFLNIVFACLFCYAAYLFFVSTRRINIDKILQNSFLKEHTFQANVVEVVSPKGYKAWLIEEHHAPLISIAFHFNKTGYAFDPVKKEGLSSIVSEMLSYGAGPYNDEIFHNMLESNGIEMSASATSDVFRFLVTTPTLNKQTALLLTKAVLTKPHFNDKDLKIVKSQMVEALKMQQENPEKVLSFAFKAKLFQDHPKGRNPLGKIEDIQNIRRQDLKNYIAEHFVSDRLVVAIAGDVNKEEAGLLLDDLFSDLKNSKSPLPDLPPIKPNYDFEYENIDRDMPQVIARFAVPGVKRLSEDFYPLYIANEVFGGSGLSSRINIAARENEGLTYGIYTYLNSSTTSPMIAGSFSSSTENYDKVLEILNQEWQKMAEKGINQEEFDKIKNSMLYSFNLRFISISSIASQLLAMQKENLGIDFLKKRNDDVKKVTLEDVNRVAAKYFSAKPSILTIGNNKRKEL